MKKNLNIFYLFIFLIISFNIKAQINECFYNPESPLLITKNTLFDYSITMSNDIIVNTGSILTITGELGMVTDARIIIKPGGKLVVDGGTITTACPGEFWKGIEVAGNTYLPQTEQNQGCIELKNNAHIEYAFIPIQTVKYLENNHEDPNGYGGIVKAGNAFFYNNYHGIRIKNYYNPFGIPQYNISFIRFCRFEVDQPYYDQYAPAFINLALVEGVKIQHNIFINTSTASLTIKNRGIYAFDASYSVFDNNIFENLSYGINDSHATPFLAPTIEHTSFLNCYKAIEISGATNPTIVFNSFKIPYCGGYESWGIRIWGSPSFNIQENVFSGIGNIKGDIGLIVLECGINSKKVYNNTFVNLVFGTQSFGENANSSRLTGLQILCNNFTNVDNDIYVENEPNGRIARYQGKLGPLPSDPAGNLFSHNIMDYYNGLPDNITYFHHNPSSNPYVYPNPIDGNITRTNTNVNWLDKIRCCPPDYTEGLDDIARLKTNINNSQNQINISTTQLQTLVDGGNTALLEMQVQNSLPPQALQLKNKLLNKSPYLSDSVMVSAIENEGGLPPSMLTQVLVANPSGAKSPDVIEQLNNRENTLPQYMMDQILAGQNRFSDKEKLEANVCFYNLQRDIALDKIERIYKNDKVHLWAKDSLLNTLNNDPRLSAKYELVFAKIEKNQINEAMILFNSIPQNYALNEKESEEYDDYLVLIGVFANLKQNGKTWSTMDSIQKQNLYLLANKAKNQADIYAINILRYTDNYFYNPQMYGSGNGKSLIGKTNYPKTESNNTDIQFKVYPNPAKDYFLIDYKLMDESTGAKIEMKDISGKVVKCILISDKQNQLVIETMELKAGVYYLQLLSNGNSKVIKIAIIKQ